MSDKDVEFLVGFLMERNQDLTALIKEAVGYAKRNGKPDDPEQKKAIKKAYHVATQLIKRAHYSEAVTILEPLCNMTMGPLKAKAAYAIVKLFISKGQFRLVRDIVAHLAQLSGKLKVTVAEKSTHWLLVYHHLDDAKRIQAVLENHEQDYGQEAAQRIAAFIATTTSQASDVKEALSTVKSDPALTEKVALKYGVRNGSPEEAEQIHAIHMTVQLMTALMEHDHVDHVYHVLEGLCNMTMGPLKSEAICLMTHLYIQKGRPTYAKKIAEKAASLKGQIKLKTAEIVALDLIEHDYIEEAESVLKILQKRDDDDSKHSVALIQKALKTHGAIMTTPVKEQPTPASASDTIPVYINDYILQLSNSIDTWLDASYNSVIVTNAHTNPQEFYMVRFCRDSIEYVEKSQDTETRTVFEFNTRTLRKNKQELPLDRLEPLYKKIKGILSDYNQKKAIAFNEDRPNE